MKLDYKASNIAKTERTYGINFNKVLTTLDDPSMSDLLFLFEAGGGNESDFDAAFAKGYDNALAIILEGIISAGFLGKEITQEAKLALADLKKEMKKNTENVRKLLQNSGEVTKN